MPIDKIDYKDILALVENRVDERRTMDFKRDLPGNSDKDKHELRVDVASFANAGGGDLFFGVDESGGVATSVPGLPDINTDAEILRMESVIQSHIDPRVPGVESKAIPMPDGAPVIVVRVPKSWRGPHLVKNDSNFRMYGRNSKGKYIFDAQEIRSAFALSEELSERIRRWRNDRIAKVLGGDTPVPIEDGARLFIHLVPLSSFASSTELSAGSLTKVQAAFLPPCVGGPGFRINFDGMVTYAPSHDQAKGTRSYCQAFRSGRVEAVWTRIVYTSNSKSVVASYAEQQMLVSIDSYLKGLSAVGVPLPIVVLVTIAGAKGAWLEPNNYINFGGKDHTIDRDMLLLPDVLVEDDGQTLSTRLRSVFDAIWNSAGWERSPNYDENRTWKPR